VRNNAKRRYELVVESRRFWSGWTTVFRRAYRSFRIDANSGVPYLGNNGRLESLFTLALNSRKCTRRIGRAMACLILLLASS
jgi:hypothetical protein